MDQFNQFNVSNTLSQPPLVQPLTSASDALSLPPLATYPSKEALFEAIQSWAKLQGYAFTITRSKRIYNRRQKVYYIYDRCPPLRPEAQVKRVRDTQSYRSGYLFQVLVIETLSSN